MKLIRREVREVTSRRRTMRRLGAQLRKERVRVRSFASELRASDPDQLEAARRVLAELDAAHRGLAHLSTDVTAEASWQQEFQALVTRSIRAARSEPAEHFSGISMVRLASLLVAAEAEMLPLSPIGATPVIVPSELLFQLHHSAFPAERMFVMSGKQVHGRVVLGAAFDVTDNRSHGSHCYADPERLARALISMSLTDCFLAAWPHSHPGRGIDASLPSPTDVGQHADWVDNFSPKLLSIVLTADGRFRFWGAALQEHRIQLQIAGPGIIEDGRSAGHVLCHLEE